MFFYIYRISACFAAKFGRGFRNQQITLNGDAFTGSEGREICSEDISYSDTIARIRIFSSECFIRMGYVSEYLARSSVNHPRLPSLRMTYCYNIIFFIKKV